MSILSLLMIVYVYLDSVFNVKIEFKPFSFKWHFDLPSFLLATGILLAWICISVFFHLKQHENKIKYLSEGARIQLFYTFSQERYKNTKDPENPQFDDLSVTINNPDILYNYDDYEIVKSGNTEQGTYKFQKKQLKK